MEHLDEGVVVLDFDGERVELQPTPAAMTRIDREFDGFAAAAQALDRASPTAMAAVVAAGAGARGREEKRLRELVVRPGFMRHYEAVVRYVTYLARGGYEEPAEAGGGADEGEG